MFNGIVEGILRVLAIKTTSQGAMLEFERLVSLDDLKIGGSIAINGVCLTVTKLNSESFEADIMPETLKVTSLGELEKGDLVNYERCLKLNARIEGHLVKGHVDEIGLIEEVSAEGNAKIIKIKVSNKISAYLIPKGSITIDGMSITIINMGPNFFTVGLIPHTVQSTIAHKYEVGTKVNLEVDDMAKYMWKYIQNNLLNKVS